MPPCGQPKGLRRDTRLRAGGWPQRSDNGPPHPSRHLPLPTFPQLQQVGYRAKGTSRRRPEQHLSNQKRESNHRVEVGHFSLAEVGQF